MLGRALVFVDELLLRVAAKQSAPNSSVFSWWGVSIRSLEYWGASMMFVRLV